MFDEDGGHLGFAQNEEASFLVVVTVGGVCAHFDSVAEEGFYFFPKQFGEKVGFGFAGGGIDLESARPVVARSDGLIRAENRQL